MSDLHHELARAAALAASDGPCWHCGAPAPGRGDGAPPRCLDAGACFARSVSPPPGPAVTFDPIERAAEKQASRDDDARRLAAGEVTREELARENGALSGVATRIAWERAGRLA